MYMTNAEFNEKYKEFLKGSHYGLDIENKEFTEWLDGKFQEFIKNDKFTYSQIKAKFGYGRFYAWGISEDSIKEVEDKISTLNLRYH